MVWNTNISGLKTSVPSNIDQYQLLSVPCEEAYTAYITLHSHLICDINWWKHHSIIMHLFVIASSKFAYNSSTCKYLQQVKRECWSGHNIISYSLVAPRIIYKRIVLPPVTFIISIVTYFLSSICDHHFDIQHILIGKWRLCKLRLFHVILFSLKHKHVHTQDHEATLDINIIQKTSCEKCSSFGGIYTHTLKKNYIHIVSTL